VGNSDDSFVNLWLMESRRLGNGWFVRGANPGAVNRLLIVNVNCLGA
jgi:hypothetical protein